MEERQAITAQEPFHTWGEAQQQSFYALSSKQSCEVVIVLLQAGGTPAITPGEKKNQNNKITVKSSQCTQTDRRVVGTGKDARCSGFSSGQLGQSNDVHPHRAQNLTDMFESQLSYSTRVINSGAQPPRRDNQKETARLQNASAP